ncbi:hypothetical protein L1887_21046 [Cichorium endivia]|nr:hypothetical protein L1887_21046 [Cichorium endivia]
MQEESMLKIEREHTGLISKIRTENDNKEENLKSNHSEELKRMQLQAENELKERTKLLKSKHEAELRELRSQHEEDCKHLEEELNIQNILQFLCLWNRKYNARDLAATMFLITILNQLLISASVVTKCYHNGDCK